MGNSKKRCPFCKTYNKPEDGIEVKGRLYCNLEHAISYGKKNAPKAKAKQEKAVRMDLRERKKALKPKSKWLSELQAMFNRYVRLRDANLGCISCDKPSSWSGQWHASHYFSRGHSSYLRFNLWNVHKSCSVCNSHLSGNIEQYTPRLIEKIGRDRYEYLVNHKSDLAVHDIEWIKRAIKITRKAIKRLESRL